MQKLRGHEIYQRDNSWVDCRMREKYERETLAKLAREEAAEKIATEEPRVGGKTTEEANHHRLTARCNGNVKSPFSSIPLIPSSLRVKIFFFSMGWSW